MCRISTTDLSYCRGQRFFLIIYGSVLLSAGHRCVIVPFRSLSHAHRPALATHSTAHPIQDSDTGLPLSEPTGSILPVNVHHAVRPRSLPTIFRPRFTHRTSIPSRALRPPLFHRCRPSSAERTADPSERMPILPVLQGHTKKSPLPPSLQGPCVVLVTFEHFKLFFLLCFHNYFTMHFNK